MAPYMTLTYHCTQMADDTPPDELMEYTESEEHEEGQIDTEVSATDTEVSAQPATHTVEVQGPEASAEADLLHDLLQDLEPVDFSKKSTVATSECVPPSSQSTSKVDMLWSIIKAAAEGQAKLPVVKQKHGLDVWGVGELHGYFPFPAPEGGCLSERQTLHDILRIDAVQPHAHDMGITETFLKGLKVDPKQIDRIEVKSTLNGGADAYDPDSNPTGFPSIYDRSITCDALETLRHGKGTDHTDACITHVTRNGPAKGKVYLACGDEMCTAHRTMVHPDRDKGPTGMLTASRLIMQALVLVMAATSAQSYESRVRQCMKVFKRHYTLLVGWLRFEAFKDARACKNKAELGGMSDKAKGARAGKQPAKKAANTRGGARQPTLMETLSSPGSSRTPSRTVSASPLNNAHTPRSLPKGKRAANTPTQDELNAAMAIIRASKQAKT